MKLSCEYLVIGSGAGGSAAAWELAQKGRDVVVLEEGPAAPTQNLSLGDCVANLYRNAGVLPIYGRPIIPFGEARCLGGGTVVNGGFFWRPPEQLVKTWFKMPNLSPNFLQAALDRFEGIEKKLSVQRPFRIEGNLDSALLHNAADSLGWTSVVAPRAIKNCQTRNRCLTGCTSGAKQTAVTNFLLPVQDLGARLLTESRVLRLRHRRGYATEAVVDNKDKRFSIQSKYFVVAAGPTQTPQILHRSGLGHSRNFGQIHLNLKVVATFPNLVNADHGTLLTHQVTQFESDGLSFMASAFNQAYLYAALGPLGVTEYTRLKEEYSRTAIYVCQVRASSPVTIHNLPWRAGLLSYRMNLNDRDRIRRGLTLLSKLLFTAGASRLYLPFDPGGICTSLTPAEQSIHRCKSENLRMVSVHMMSSCSLGSVCDPEAKVRNIQNVWIADASVIPSNLGVGPQGTTMALASEIAARLPQ